MVCDTVVSAHNGSCSWSMIAARLHLVLEPRGRSGPVVAEGSRLESRLETRTYVLYMRYIPISDIPVATGAYVYGSTDCTL